MSKYKITKVTRDKARSLVGRSALSVLRAEANYKGFEASVTLPDGSKLHAFWNSCWNILHPTKCAYVLEEYIDE